MSNYFKLIIIVIFLEQRLFSISASVCVPCSPNRYNVSYDYSHAGGSGSDSNKGNGQID